MNRRPITSVLALCAAISLAGCVPAQPSISTEASASAKPGKSSTNAPSEKLLTVASLELPGNLTPEQLGSTIIQDRLTQWISSGQTDANRAAWLKSTLPEGEFIRNTITDKIGNTYADALFVSNWRDIPELKNWVDFQKTNHTASLELWFKTYKSGKSNDIEPYEGGSKVDSTTVVPPQTADTVSIAITATEYDNASKNRSVTLDPSVATINGNKFIVDTTLKLIDGNWKISTLNTLAFSNSN